MTVLTNDQVLLKIGDRSKLTSLKSLGQLQISKKMQKFRKYKRHLAERASRKSWSDVMQSGFGVNFLFWSGEL